MPLLSPVLLALTNWVAAETLSSWGEAIRTALPSGLNRVARRRVVLTREGAAALAAVAQSERPEPAGELSDADVDLLSALSGSGSGSMTSGSLARRHGQTSTCARLYDLARRGLVEIDDEWTSGAGGRWRNVVFGSRHVSLEVARQRTSRAPSQRRAVECLWEGEPAIVSRGALCRRRLHTGGDQIVGSQGPGGDSPRSPHRCRGCNLGRRRRWGRQLRPHRGAGRCPGSDPIGR